MADLFATGVQIPDLDSGQSRPADEPGFIRIISRNKQLIGRTSDGVEHPLSGSGGSTQTTFLNIDGGSSTTVFTDYVLRLDFGVNGANINPQGTQ